MGNDPINNADPSGGFSVPGALIGSGTGFVLGMAYGFFHNNDGGAMLKDGLIGAAIGAAAGGFSGDLFGGAGGAGNASMSNVLNAVSSKAANIAPIAVNAANGAAQMTGNFGVDNAYNQQSFDNFKGQYADNVEWNDLSKSDLTNYFKSTFHTDPTAKQLGDEYEKIYYNWENSQPEAKGHNFKMNKDPWEDANDRNTVPDMTATKNFHRFENITPGSHIETIEPIKNGAIFEIKSGKNGIYLSSNDKQILGHLDNLAVRFKELIAERFNPSFTLVTTADVPYSTNIGSYASNLKINYYHDVGQYRIIKGRWEFRFVNNLIRKLWWSFKQAFGHSL